MIGAATVTTADVEASNGIIHVIDKVLMPPPGDICYNVISHTIVPGATNLICNSYMFVENYTMGGKPSRVVTTRSPTKFQTSAPSVAPTCGRQPSTSP